MNRFVHLALAFSICTLTTPAWSNCPVGQKITIDYDIPGSGYSETSNNWTTWNTSPCNGAGYRYLSHTVGDGTRKGKAIWTPAITVAGHYRVVTGYRATENRSNDADYFAYDDKGAVVHKVVDQTKGHNCEWVEMGTFYCQPGGNCRVELDGTDDSKSDCADVTVYELLNCDGAGTGGSGGSGGGGDGRCDGIRAHAAWEVCEETATTCKGVFTDGAGCTSYCAAAGMTCTARFGGEPGCQKEVHNVLGCADVNGHLSDWCECEGSPIEPDAGAAGAGTGGAGAGGMAGNAGASGDAGGGVAGWGGVVSDASVGGSGGEWDSSGGSVPGGSATDGGGEGCGCTVVGTKSIPWVLFLAFIALVLGRRQGGKTSFLQ